MQSRKKGPVFGFVHTFLLLILIVLFCGMVVALVLSSIAFSRTSSNSLGQMGPTGPTGKDGKEGPMGPSDGPIGLTGPKGDAGVPGDLGPPGEIGFAFSSGTLVTSAVSDAIPRVMGTGNSRAYTIDIPSALGESTIPEEVDEFSQPIPSNGTIHTLVINASAHASNVLSGDVVYDFRILRAIAGPNNSGQSYLIGSDPLVPQSSSFGYKLTPFFGTLTILATQTTGNNLLTAQNIVTTSLSVSSGERIALRVIVSSGSAADVQLLDRIAFSANVKFTKS